MGKRQEILAEKQTIILKTWKCGNYKIQYLKFKSTGLSYLTRLTVDTKICALDDGLIEIIKTKKEKKSILKK